VNSKLILGRRPTVQYRANPVNDGETVYESRFFPDTHGTIYLHAHSGSAPYVSSSTSNGIDIDIHQDPACPMVGASLSIAHGSSLAKMVTRYRMAALAWIIGWAARILYRWVAVAQETQGVWLAEVCDNQN
jgi:hypothetical protein